MNLTYKTSTNLDINKIYELSKTLIDTHEDIESIDYDKVLKWVFRKIEENIHEYTSIYLDNRLVGYYRFHEEDGKMELDDFYIFESFRNKGIGTIVLKKCIEESKLPIFLYVFIKNEKAIQLYDRFGFEIVETIGNSRYIMER